MAKPKNVATISGSTGVQKSAQIQLPKKPSIDLEFLSNFIRTLPVPRNIKPLMRRGSELKAMGYGDKYHPKKNYILKPEDIYFEKQLKNLLTIQAKGLLNHEFLKLYKQAAIEDYNKSL